MGEQLMNSAKNAASAVAMVLLAGTAANAADCADRDRVVERLETRFNETAIGYVMGETRNVMEVYASPGMHTWTVLVTLPDRGLTCLAASGKGATDLKSTVNMM